MLARAHGRQAGRSVGTTINFCERNARPSVPRPFIYLSTPAEPHGDGTVAAMFASASSLLFLGRTSRGIRRGKGYFCTTATTTTSTTRQLPVAVLIDLDNVAPTIHSRKNVHGLIDPIQEFAKAVGPIQRFQAFANEATQTWVSPEEKERDFDQVFREDDFGATGYDENDGQLRCGVCGAKMKLTKKDRAAGRNMFDKLNKHMRMLHDREQEKRKTRRKQKKNLSDNDKMKFMKYEAAQVGLYRSPARRIKPKGHVRKQNDLFRLLKQRGVNCRAVSDVDDAIYETARKWIKGFQPNKKSPGTLKGCLIVVSADGDFADILKEAWSRDFLTVSIGKPNDDSMQGHTLKLRRAADLVLTYIDMTVEDVESDLTVFGTGAWTLHPEAISKEGHLLLQDLLRKKSRLVDSKRSEIDISKES